MRWALLLSLLFTAVAGAAELSPFQQWLSFVQGMAFNAAGPSGMYAAQDKQELQPGKVLYLRPASSRAALRWSSVPIQASLVRAL
ncbi:hypothetical protein [Lysobacter tyrosinilyticus]